MAIQSGPRRATAFVINIDHAFSLSHNVLDHVNNFTVSNCSIEHNLSGIN